MRRTAIARRAFLGGLGLTLAATAAARAAPRAELWPRWQARTPGSTRTVDHGRWAGFLGRYLVEGDDGITRVRYRAVSAADRDSLTTYLGTLAATPVDALDGPEQMAFWINLYNALTVALILEHAPKTSIREINISPGLFSRGPWGRKLVTVMAEPLSLDDIEHRILRPIWRDNRIHYAVNCASLGCPDLRAEPYAAARLEMQLAEQAARFVNHPRGCRVERGELYVSSLYDWYVADFGGDAAGVIGHLESHAAPALRNQLLPILFISGHSYDWRLNAA